METQYTKEWKLDRVYIRTNTVNLVLNHVNEMFWRITRLDNGRVVGEVVKLDAAVKAARKFASNVRIA